MARKVDETYTKCRNPTDIDWTRTFAHDGRDPRSWPQTKPCRGQHVLEQSYTANQHGAWISCAKCALRLQYIPRHTARMTSVSTPSSASVQEALKRMSLLRDNDFTAKAVRDTIAEVEGRKPRKKKPTPQTTIVYNTVYNSGAASSATISSGTPVRRDISTPPSPQSSPTTRLWRRFVVGILQKERMRVRRGNALMMDVFSFVFVERCFSCLAWVHQTLHVGGSFLTRTHVFLVTVCCSPRIPRRLSCPLVLLLSGRQRWTSAEHVALSISVFLLLPFYSVLSQSVFLERYRED